MLESIWLLWVKILWILIILGPSRFIRKSIKRLVCLVGFRRGLRRRVFDLFVYMSIKYLA
jgi:hypothetical protein